MATFNVHFVCYFESINLILKFSNILLQVSLVPGQELVLQSNDSNDGPKQLLPPPDGAGLEHVRVLVFCPTPQVLVHDEYPPHPDHCPLTEQQEIKTYSFHTLHSSI